MRKSVRASIKSLIISYLIKFEPLSTIEGSDAAVIVGSVGIASQAQGLLEKPSIIRLSNSNWCIPSTQYTQCLVVGGYINSSKMKHNVTQKCCAKSPEATALEMSGGEFILV